MGWAWRRLSLSGAARQAGRSAPCPPTASGRAVARGRRPASPGRAVRSARSLRHMFALRYSPVYHVYDPNFIVTFHELLSRKCPARLLLVPAARRGEPPAAPSPHPAGRRQHASTYRPRRPSAGTGLIALGTSFSIRVVILECKLLRSLLPLWL